MARDEELILAEVMGGLGVITLNRPKALNALSLGMVRALHEVLRQWADDPAVHGLLLRGSARPSANGGLPAMHFCAGGDIRFMHEAAMSGDLAVDDFFTEEYALDHALHVWPKPTIAWMDGITMGGGMGLAQGCQLRIATETTRMAMPETCIGLIPDVAGGWFLGRCPGAMGDYLGVTGVSFKAGDALALGLADAIAQGDSLEALLRSFESQAVPDAATLLARVHEHVAQQAPAAAPQPELMAHRKRIDRHFSLPTVQAIDASLREDGSEWAQATLAQMAGNSPLMMCVTLAHLRRVRGLPLADEFRAERAVVRQCFAIRKGAASETVEGVRALAVDKDHTPRWNPATLAEVTPAMVDAFLEPVWPAHMHPLRDLRDPA